MVSFGFKSGTGTSSRVLPAAEGGSITLGVLVQVRRSALIDYKTLTNV